MNMTYQHHGMPLSSRKECHYPLKRGLGEPKKWSLCFGEEKI